MGPEPAAVSRTFHILCIAMTSLWLRDSEFRILTFGVGGKTVTTVRTELTRSRCRGNAVLLEASLDA